MIDIFGHLIDETQIIGISPTRIEQPVKNIQNCSIERLSFDLYLVHYKITFSSKYASHMTKAQGDEKLTGFAAFLMLHKMLWVAVEQKDFIAYIPPTISKAPPISKAKQRRFKKIIDDYTKTKTARKKPTGRKSRSVK